MINRKILCKSGCHILPRLVCLRVDESHHDVASSVGDYKALVVVRESTGMHEHPAAWVVCHRTVVADEPSPAALVVVVLFVQCDVDRVRRRVVVWHQPVLFIRVVAHEEVHDCFALRVVAFNHTHRYLHTRPLQHTHTHLFDGPFSGTTRVSRYQKGKTNRGFTEARDSE